MFINFFNWDGFFYPWYCLAWHKEKGLPFLIFDLPTLKTHECKWACSNFFFTYTSHCRKTGREFLSFGVKPASKTIVLADGHGGEANISWTLFAAADCHMLRGQTCSSLYL